MWQDARLAALGHAGLPPADPARAGARTNRAQQAAAGGGASQQSLGARPGAGPRAARSLIRLSDNQYYVIIVVPRPDTGVLHVPRQWTVRDLNLP